MAEDLAAIEFTSAPGQDVLYSVSNVNNRAELAYFVDLLTTVCYDYPRFAEWSDEYLRNRRV
jgi:hypothetical protein